MEKLYAQILYQASGASAKDAEVAVTRLVEHLKTRGRLKLLPSILRQYKVLLVRNRSIAPTVEVASEHESAAALAQARNAGIDVSKAVINKNLVRGWRARSKGTLIDQSGKRALIDLYRKITT